MNNKDYLDQNISELLSVAQPEVKMPDESKAKILAMLIESSNRRVAGKKRATVVGSLAIRIAAAAVLIMGVILFVKFLPGRANAFELLQEVVATNDMYEGWVHIKADRMPELPDESGKIAKSLVWHLNPAKKVDVMMVVNCDNEIFIGWDSEKEYTIYRSRTNEVTIADAVLDKTKLSDMIPWQLSIGLFSRPTFSAILDLVEYADQVHYFKSADYDQFDIDLLNDGSAGADNQDHLTIWVDPDTKLIHECDLDITSKGRGINFLFKFTYGEPSITNIYDLGVPDDAVVIDNRLSEDVKAICERLENRVSEGFGDFVAVLTESVVDSNQSLQKNSIQLFGQKGEALMYARYPSYDEALSSDFATIGGWPTPQIVDVLERAEGAYPEFFFVTDGQKGWRGVYDRSSKAYTGLEKIINKGIILELIPGFSLSGQIWPCSRSIGFDKRYSNRKVSLIYSDENPEEIGLCFDISDAASAMRGIGRSEFIYWMDPACDDMVVESTERTYGPDRKSIIVEKHTEYLSFDKLRGEKFYPTCWQTTVTRYSNDGSKGRRALEYHLTIYPDMELEDWWFTEDLIKDFNSV